jgi:hypothetical protein
MEYPRFFINIESEWKSPICINPEKIKLIDIMELACGSSLLLAADMIDEMQITYIPIILGKGIPLFPAQPKESKWELIGNTTHKSDALTVKLRKKS